MNSRINILSSRRSKFISRGTLESLVHVGWITGINGFTGFGFGLGIGFSADFEVDAPGDVVFAFVSAAAFAAALARLRS
jgi:hypothetical protein